MLDTLLNKFQAVQVDTDSKLSEVDLLYCRQHQKAFEAARQEILELSCVWSQMEAEQQECLKLVEHLASASPYLSASNGLSIGKNDWEKQLSLLPARFISNLISYFNSAYRISLSAEPLRNILLPQEPECSWDCEADSKEMDDYRSAIRTVKIDYHMVVEHILAQMDGRSFSEQAFHELRESCRSAAWWYDNHPKFERKRDLIVFSGHACTYDHGYTYERWGLSDYMKKIIYGLAHFETGRFSTLPPGFSELLSYRNIKEQVIPFSAGAKLKQLRLYKNGRVDLKFAQEQDALDFISIYLGNPAA